MGMALILRNAAIGLTILGLSACGGGSGFGDSNPFRNNSPEGQQALDEHVRSQRETTLLGEDNRDSFFDLFVNIDNPNTTLEVNRYLWNASLEVLNFLPIESVDPFSGVIVTGYGTPPGGGRAYRAVIHVTDPALDARSLKVAMATRSGAVSNATVRAVEDAILTRARQLRMRDRDL